VAKWEGKRQKAEMGCCAKKEPSEARLWQSGKAKGKRRKWVVARKKNRAKRENHIHHHNLRSREASCPKNKNPGSFAEPGFVYYVHDNVSETLFG
jgi:hypothetical protein